jgi:carboxypeptidase C (cathepsin A)
MDDAVHAQENLSDQSLLDTTPYGSGKDDSVADATEESAITQHTFQIDGTSIPYTARAGHLVSVDMYSSRPAAKIFYVAFTANAFAPTDRPVTFFYNGGPGSSSVFLLLGSFGPRRIKTNMPYFTPPAPYVLEDNQDSLLDCTDLVFINPVGTGYSAAVAPGKNGDFWGVDEDARSIKQFIKRYLTVFKRWNSPKFLFGESYGTPRTCVLTWLLHEEGVDLNGIVLQSSVLDYSKTSNPIGLLPTLAADARYHKKVTVSPFPSDLSIFMTEVEKFARGPYAAAISEYPSVNPTVLQSLSDMVGIRPNVLKSWKLDLSLGGGSVFLTRLLEDDGLAAGSYDGRVTAEDRGIARSIDPNSGSNDPTMTAVGGVYTAMWHVYLNDELKFTSTSSFMDTNDEAFANWNFSHVDATGAQTGGADSLYTAGDLAAAMELNPYLKVFSANGYYDAVTPFLQTILNFERMPLGGSHAPAKLTIRNYESGHMIYLDNKSRSAMKADLAEFYRRSGMHAVAAAASQRPEEAPHVHHSRFRRRSNSIPY